MKKIQTLKSIQEFRRKVEEAFRTRRDELINIIDALTVGPRIKTAIELTTSPIWQYAWASLYSGIRFGNSKEAKSIKELRQARIKWIEEWEEEIVEKEERLGDWRVRILDSTDYPRPKTETVKLVYAHSSSGMKPGHNLSILSQKVGAGSWTLPLEIAVINVGVNAGEFGSKQVVEFAQRQGWGIEDVLALDAYYTKVPYLRPMHEAGVNLMGRVAQNRTFYLPPPPYSGRGRPKEKGRKIKLNDARTLPQPDIEERVELKDGRYCEVSRWDDIRMKKWLRQSLVLYRVIEYRADGSKKYRRPLWLIYVPAQAEMPIPTPKQGQAIYDARFSIEHSIRFLKQELGLIAAQFNGKNASLRVALWLELVATAFWQLFVLKSAANIEDKSLPPWWTKSHLTPGAVRRLALAIFVKFALQSPQPKPRGKSPGRALGTRFQPRWRFKIFRRRKRRAVA